MKFFTDKHKIEQEFAIHDLVYLKLQPYYQMSVALRTNLKLTLKFYRPYRVLDRIGTVTYRLALPPNNSVHPVFHVSLLKKATGDHITAPP
uniref:Tf2-1-like SH3-like domain-containing protein n=1 Tax=Rhizophora mucronata TaxID=61149 RepID=A0A2P2QWZ6_RHIMU